MSTSEDHGELDSALRKGLDDISSDVNQLARNLVGSVDQKQLDSFAWSLWAACVDYAKSASEGAMDRLVDFIGCVKSLKAPLDEHGTPIKSWGGEYWKDLPILGAEMREEWNLDPRNDSQLLVWCQLNRFAAKLTATGTCDFAMYGIWAMRDALEGEIPWCPPPSARIAIPVACIWIAEAGDTLMQCQQGYGRSAQGGSRCSRFTGFSDDRWRLWSKEFASSSKDVNLSAELRSEAQRAHEKIERMLQRHH